MMNDIHAYQQEIQQYSLEELLDIATHIDRVQYPERFRMVVTEIEKRQGKHPTQPNTWEYV